MIKVGDIVRVTDWGRQYSRRTAWFKEHINQLETEWLINFAYGDQTHYMEHKCDDITKYKVLYIDIVAGLCLITPFSWFNGVIDDVYLIGLDAVELYDKPIEMTISKIEETLGIKNLKIIKENENG